MLRTHAHQGGFFHGLSGVANSRFPPPDSPLDSSGRICDRTAPSHLTLHTCIIQGYQQGVQCFTNHSTLDIRGYICHKRNKSQSGMLKRSLAFTELEHVRNDCERAYLFSGAERVMAHSASMAAAATLGLAWLGLACPADARCFSRRAIREGRPPPRRKAACKTGKGTPWPDRCGFVKPCRAARALSCRSSSSAWPHGFPKLRPHLSDFLDQRPSDAKRSKGQKEATGAKC